VVAWLGRVGWYIEGGAEDLGGVPGLRATSAGAQAESAPDPACATLSLPLLVELQQGQRRTTVGAGEQVHVAHAKGGWLDLYVLRAEHRPIIDRRCNAGRDLRHDDFELVLVERLAPGPVVATTPTK